MNVEQQWAMNKHGVYFIRYVIFYIWFTPIPRASSNEWYRSITLRFLLFRLDLKALNVPPLLLGFGCPLKHAVIDNCYKLGRAWLGRSWQSCAFCLEISHSVMRHEKLCFSPCDLLPLFCLLHPSVHLSIMPIWQRMDSFCPRNKNFLCCTMC